MSNTHAVSPEILRRSERLDRYTFELRAELTRAHVMKLAARYPFHRQDSVLNEIGCRSRLAGFYSSADFLLVCEETRSSRRCGRNSSRQIERTTGMMIATISERVRIESLLALSGVSWRTASVVLHFTFEDQYPILSAQVLSLSVGEQPSMNFGLWWTYVEAMRALAVKYQVSLRVLYCALWQFATEQQPGVVCEIR